MARQLRPDHGIKADELAAVDRILGVLDREALEEDARYLEEDFGEFIPAAWPIIEPAKKFTPNWHIDAIAEHLEAVVRGEIPILLVSLPPGHMKTLTVSVMFPAWLWCCRPGLRLLTACYSRDFAERDALSSRMIIESRWYQDRWPLRLRRDTNRKDRYENEHRGYRVTTTVKGRATGEGGSILLCLPPEAVIQTEAGPIPIGTIVLERRQVRVLAYDHATDQAVWAAIEAYERSPARPMVRITTAAGRVVRCTSDHPVWIDGRGYIPASQVCPGDRVSALRSSGSARSDAARISTESLLHPGMQGSGPLGSRQGQELQAMPAVREDDLPAAGPSRQDAGRAVLLACLPWPMADRAEQPRLRVRADRGGVRPLRQTDPTQTQRRGRAQLLLALLPIGRRLGQRASQRAAAAWAGALRAVRQALQAQASFEQSPRPQSLLLAALQGQGAQRGDAGHRQLELRPWGLAEPVSRLRDSVEARDQGQGRACLSSVRRASDREAQGPLRAPHRLRQDQWQPGQPDLPLRSVPWQGARLEAEACRVEADSVVAVEPCEPDGPWVYNVRVATHHNYFADGLLLHNCDDLISMTDIRSPARRAEAIHFLSDVVPTRLRDESPGALIIVGQRGHEQDPIGYMLAQQVPGTVHLNLPARYNPSTTKPTRWFRDPRKEAGEPLWPKLYPERRLRQLERQMTPDGAAAQLQQTPTVGGGSILPRKYWRVWSEPQLPACAYYMLSIDPAMKSGPDNSMWACQVWGIFEHVEPLDPKARVITGERRSYWCMILVEAWQGHVSYHEAMQKILGTYDYWTIRSKEGDPGDPPDATLIEDKSAGPLMIKDLEGMGIQGVIGVDPKDKSKEDRAERESRALFMGRVFVPGRRMKDGTRHPTVMAVWAEFVVNQCALFPAGQFNDHVDCFSQAAKHAREAGYIDLDSDASEVEPRAEQESRRLESLYG